MADEIPVACAACLRIEHEPRMDEVGFVRARISVARPKPIPIIWFLHASLFRIRLLELAAAGVLRGLTDRTIVLYSTIVL